MAYQSIFKRYELKYMITQSQKERLFSEINKHMQLDKYGRTVIRNIYFDTDNYRLIRRSIEKPKYKEKIRIRSYSKADPDSKVFVELKKKYKSVVYKRRIKITEEQAVDWLVCDHDKVKDSQIKNEIDYFMSYYGSLKPKVFLSYEREAFYSKDGSDLRITFDDNILCRGEDLSLESDVYGERILDSDKVIMEIKTAYAIPMWLSALLSEEKIFKTSFSKYGTAYRLLIFPKLEEDLKNGNIV